MHKFKNAKLITFIAARFIMDPQHAIAFHYAIHQTNVKSELYLSVNAWSSLGRRWVPTLTSTHLRACSASTPTNQQSTIKVKNNGRTVILEKLIQGQGFGSKKQCRGMIQDGMVSLSGSIIRDPGHKLVVEEGLSFEVDGVKWMYREKAYIVLHKPIGYECSNRPTSHPSVFELLPPPLQVVAM
jgi:hypothetical protein